MRGWAAGGGGRGSYSFERNRSVFADDGKQSGNPAECVRDFDVLFISGVDFLRAATFLETPRSDSIVDQQRGRSYFRGFNGIICTATFSGYLRLI